MSGIHIHIAGNRALKLIEHPIRNTSDLFNEAQVLTVVCKIKLTGVSVQLFLNSRSQGLISDSFTTLIRQYAVNTGSVFTCFDCLCKLLFNARLASFLGNNGLFGLGFFGLESLFFGLSLSFFFLVYFLR